MEVFWTTGALDDLDEAQDFIARESPVAAYKLASEIIGRTSRLLAANPLAGRQGRVSGTREFVVSGTHYIVAYRVLDRVEILAVVHGAQKWPTDFEP